MTMTMPVMMPVLVPAMVMTVTSVTVLLLDDDDIPGFRRHACDDRHSQSESRDGSESEYQLAHAYSPLG